MNYSDIPTTEHEFVPHNYLISKIFNVNVEPSSISGNLHIRLGYIVSQPTTQMTCKIIPDEYNRTRKTFTKSEIANNIKIFFRSPDKLNEQRTDKLIGLSLPQVDIQGIDTKIDDNSSSPKIFIMDDNENIIYIINGPSYIAGTNKITNLSHSIFGQAVRWIINDEAYYPVGTHNINNTNLHFLALRELLGESNLFNYLGTYILEYSSTIVNEISLPVSYQLFYGETFGDYKYIITNLNEMSFTRTKSLNFFPALKIQVNDSNLTNTYLGRQYSDQLFYNDIYPKIQLSLADYCGASSANTYQAIIFSKHLCIRTEAFIQ